MRVLVVSDIHGNLAALDAVLDDAERHFAYEAIWCLGDTVGYGPEPNECVARMQQLEATCVIGNHDWAALGNMDIDDFNPEARRAVLWTRNQLSDENRAWLESLSSDPLEVDAFTLTHGSPRDPIWEYILHPWTARANFEYFTTPYCLVGHTHVPAYYIWQPDDGNVKEMQPEAGEPVELGRPTAAASQPPRAIINPGSVGQPRDNDARASYAIVDTEEAVWRPCRVAYPIEITQAHMRNAGLPERLINRLTHGL